MQHIAQAATTTSTNRLATQKKDQIRLLNQSWGEDVIIVDLLEWGKKYYYYYYCTVAVATDEDDGNRPAAAAFVANFSLSIF